MSTIGRKNNWAHFRARVALAALREDRTPEELARRYGVSVEEIAEWRAFLAEHAAEAFGLASFDRDSAPAGDITLQEEIRRLDHALREADREAKRVGAEHEARVAELAAGYEHEAARLQARIGVLGTEINARDAELGARAAALAERDARIAALDDELSAARARIEQLMQSWSWRITRPLREVGRLAASGSSPPRASEPPPPAPVPPRPTPVAVEPPPVVSLVEPAPAPPEVRAAVAAPAPEPPSEPFDSAFYLEMYPDVLRYPEGPLRHYLDHGRREKRLGTLPEFPMSGDFGALDPARETVLLVSHEASRTGAPILCAEIARSLRPRYNVVVLLLKGGDMEDAFREAADVVVGPIDRPDSELIVSLNIARLLDRCPVTFAIVNSIVSRAVLPPLAHRFVPTVTLIHEFASYTRPREAIGDTILWSSDVVFSAETVRDNALATLPDLELKPGAVLRQGRCPIDATVARPGDAERESERIRAALRPAGSPPDLAVVLGVGFVQIRKGVDLFIACADRVLRAMGSRPCRFVWVGDGYDPEGDNAYSSYLEDQVLRAGLGERLAFVGSTEAIAAAYGEADVLVISSRLDPLPNVGIDAMEMGLPLACFDRASGIAEVLREGGLAAECVADYLDIEGLAARVKALVEDAGLRSSVGQRSQAAARRAFDMGAYVAAIESRVRARIASTAAEAADCELIAAAEAFDASFVSPPGEAWGRDVAVRWFVRAWATGVRLRKPCAGFHPGVYAERAAPRSGADPFAEYLRAGSPEGPWSATVLRPAENPARQAGDARILLHLHLESLDAVEGIAERLARNALRPEIVASVPWGVAGEDMARALASHGLAARVRAVHEDCDSWESLVRALEDASPEAYDWVGHLHDDEDSLDPFMLENLLGGEHAMIDTVVAAMAARPQLGLVFPDDPNVPGWQGSRAEASRIASLAGLRDLPGEHFEFPSRGMFWARGTALRAVREALGGSAFFTPAEAAMRRLRARALDRLAPALFAHAGSQWAVTHVPGCTRAFPRVDAAAVARGGS